MSTISEAISHLHGCSGDLKRAARALAAAHDEHHRLLVAAAESSGITEQEAAAVNAAAQSTDDRLGALYAAVTAYNGAASGVVTAWRKAQGIG